MHSRACNKENVVATIQRENNEMVVFLNWPITPLSKLFSGRSSFAVVQTVESKTRHSGMFLAGIALQTEAIPFKFTIPAKRLLG
jgi:hypothetical protein